MPSYELTLLLRTMPKAEVAATLRRAADAIFLRDGLIRTIENLGHKALPYKLKSYYGTQKEAHYFLVKFEGPVNCSDELSKEYNLDVDVLRQKIYRTQEPETTRCTLEEELQPPAYRQEVQEMIAASKKIEARNSKKKFQYHSGLDYYPFNK